MSTIPNIPRYMRKSIESELRVFWNDVIEKLGNAYPNMIGGDFYGLRNGSNFYGLMDTDGDIFFSETLNLEPKELIYIVIIHEMSHVVAEGLLNFKMFGRNSSHGFLFRKVHGILMNEFLKKNEDEVLNIQIKELMSSKKMRRYYPF